MRDEKLPIQVTFRMTLLADEITGPRGSKTIRTIRSLKFSFLIWVALQDSDSRIDGKICIGRKGWDAGL